MGFKFRVFMVHGGSSALGVKKTTLLTKDFQPLSISLKFQSI